MKRKFKGFTLVEILLALVVLGIIALLVLPITVAEVHKKSLAAAIKKSYIELGNVLTSISSERYYKGNVYNSILEKSRGGNMQKFMEYFDMTRNCGTTPQPCFAQKYKSISGSTTTDFKCTNGYSFLVKDGSAYCIIPAVSPSTPAHIYVDTNGSQAPNVGGRDMFSFYIWEDFSIDDLAPDKRAKTNRDEKASACSSSPEGAGCLSNILNYNWIMDY